LFRSQRQNCTVTSASPGCKACTLCTWKGYSWCSRRVRHTDTGEMPTAAATLWTSSTMVRLSSPLCMCELSVFRCQHPLGRNMPVYCERRSTDTNILVLGPSRFVYSSAYRCLTSSVLLRISPSTRLILASSENVYAILCSGISLSTARKQTHEHVCEMWQK
jgi:hypothetical protein